MPSIIDTNFYTKSQVDALIPNLSNYYTKTESDARYLQANQLKTVNGNNLVGSGNIQIPLGENWLPKGTSTNARTWTYTLITGKKYRVGINWSSTTNTGLIYKEFTWNGTTIAIDTFTENVTGVTVVGITVVGVIVVLQLNAVSSGITITTKFGTSSNGYIGSLEELQ